MKTAIHPKYFEEAKIRCACGNVMVMGSTLPEISVELCSHCHPFYTGKQKLLDTAGRVEKFQKRADLKAKVSEGRVGKKVKRARVTAQKEQVKKEK